MEGGSDLDALLDTETRQNSISSDNETFQVSHKWQVFRASMNTIVHTLMGGGVFVTLWFTWTLDPGPYQQHIILCVIGVSFYNLYIFASQGLSFILCVVRT